MAGLTTRANIRGQQIDLALAWSDPAGQARSLRLLRRRVGYPTAPGDGLLLLDLADLFEPAPALAVAGATKTSPIQITTALPHGLSTNNRLAIAGVTGNTNANGSWTIVVTSSTTFTLTGSTGNTTYSGGGTAFPPPTASPWARIDRTRYLILDDVAEGGVLQAELALFYADASAPQPAQAAVTAYYAPPSGSTDPGLVLESLVSSVTYVDTATGSNAQFGLVTTITIYANPGGGPEAAAGTLVVSTKGTSPGPTTEVKDYTQPDPITGQPLDKQTAQPSPDQIVWTPAAQTVTNATNDAPIVITTQHPHGLSSGAEVVVQNVTGNTAANNTATNPVWSVFVTGPTTFTLADSQGNASYTGGSTGTATPASTSVPFLLEELESTTSTLRAIQPLAVGFVTSVTSMLAATGATNTTPIEITTVNAHGLATGAMLTIAGVTGNTAANGTWSIFVTGPTTFRLTGSVGNGAYTGGGSLTTRVLVAYATDVAPIEIMTASPHGLPSGTHVTIAGVTGNTAANGTWPILVTGPKTFTLTRSVGNGAYTGGGVGSVPLRTVDFVEAQNPDTGEVGRSIDVVDLEPPRPSLVPGLDPGVTYYYAAWEDAGKGFPAAPSFTALRTATGSHGFSDKLFSLLPAVHRFYDDPASGPQPGSGLPGSWQLRRLLQVVGPALDQAWSLGESLRTLSDVFEVRADDLPLVGGWIGWELDRTRSTQRQRTDILFAPDVFATVGTVPNIEALVHRSTGWSCQAKEFVNNVFLTNFVEPIRLCEIWQAPPTMASQPTYPLVPPAVQMAVTQAAIDVQPANDSIDARPALVTEPSGTPQTWLFWHSRRPDAHASTRRQIWMQALDGSVPMRPVTQYTPEDVSGLTYTDEWPTAIAAGNVVQLFWISDRKGTPAVWTRSLSQGAPAPPTQLTQHPAGDDAPAVVQDTAGTLWVFFHSSRRGPTDIWAITLPSGANATWSPPFRITTGHPRDVTPAAFVDASGQLNLLWSADYGDRSRIVQATLSGTLPIASTSVALVSSAADDMATYRDVTPAIVVYNNRPWAFWSSNRDGVFRLYASYWQSNPPPNTPPWSTPVPVTAGRHAEAEPAAFVDAAGALRLLFRSQQGGEQYRSRTVDMENLGAIQRGLLSDRWHYTYSVLLDQTSPYARDAVGLYVTPDQMGSLDDVDRVKALVEPFRPLPVRFVWYVQPTPIIETVHVHGTTLDIKESYSDSADFLGPVGESYSVALPDWSLFYTNTLGDVSGDPANLHTLWRRTFYPGFQ